MASIRIGMTEDVAKELTYHLRSSYRGYGNLKLWAFLLRLERKLKNPSNKKIAGDGMDSANKD